MSVRQFLQYSQPNKRNNYGMKLQMIKFRFLPLIEILRRVSNWFLHQKIEDEIQYYKKSDFYPSKLSDPQIPSFQSRSTLPNEVQALPIALIHVISLFYNTM